MLPKRNESIAPSDSPHFQTHSHHSSTQSAGVSIINGYNLFDETKLKDWYSKYQSCQIYFINHAQHQSYVQIIATFTNIWLPFQRTQGLIAAVIDPKKSFITTPMDYPVPLRVSIPTLHRLYPPYGLATQETVFPFVSLVLYIKRLIFSFFRDPSVVHVR